MSDLTNTPKREPAYGMSARRFNAEQALGRRVVEILARKWAPNEEHAPARDYASIRQAACSLGLLDAKPSDDAPDRANLRRVE